MFREAAARMAYTWQSMCVLDVLPVPPPLKVPGVESSEKTLCQKSGRGDVLGVDGNARAETEI